MFLSDIRFLVGTHLSLKGLPPTIIAPVINILTGLDQELMIAGFDVSPELEEEINRLKKAIILYNHPVDEDEDEDSKIQEEIDTVLNETVSTNKTVGNVEDDDDYLPELDDDDD